MAPEDPDPGMFWLSSPPQRSPSRMSFRSRAVPRQALVVLALIVCSACGVFESQERVPRRRTERARFPVRRIGRGIPLGETGLPPELSTRRIPAPSSRGAGLGGYGRGGSRGDVMPEARFDLISLTLALTSGWSPTR